MAAIEKEKKRLKKEKAAAKKRLKLARKELAKELKEQRRLQDIFSERNAEETRKLITAASSGWTPSVERHLAAGAAVNDMAVRAAAPILALYQQSDPKHSCAGYRDHSSD